MENGTEPSFTQLFNDFAVSNFRAKVSKDPTWQTRAAILLQQIRTYWLSRMKRVPSPRQIVELDGVRYVLQTYERGTCRYVREELFNEFAFVYKPLTALERLNRQLELQMVLGAFVQTVEDGIGVGAWAQVNDDEWSGYVASLEDEAIYNQK